MVNVSLKTRKILTINILCRLAYCLFLLLPT